jgi:hypothetical protein
VQLTESKSPQIHTSKGKKQSGAYILRDIQSHRCVRLCLRIGGGMSCVGLGLRRHRLRALQDRVSIRYHK